MKKIIVKNETSGTIFIKNLENFYMVKPRTIEAIDAKAGDKICVFKNTEKMSRICLGMYLSKSDFGNVWFLGLTHLVYPYAFFTVPENQDKIVITEKICAPFSLTVLYTLLFNGDVADSYEYPRKRDKILVKIFSLIILIPLGFLAFVFMVFSFHEPTVSGFSADTLITWLLWGVFVAIFAFFYKNFSGIAKFDDRLKTDILEAKTVIIREDLGWFVKYAESERF